MKLAKKKSLVIFSIVAISLASLILFSFALGGHKALADSYGLETAGTQAGLKTNLELAKLIGTIIQYSLQLVGVLLVILVIYGGVLWMTAGGKDEQIKKARGILINAIVGLLIIVASYSIANYVITKLSAL